MRFKRLTIALLGMAMSIPVSVQAELKIAAIFGDNMVLEEKMRIPVWGWTTPGGPVTVTFAGQTRPTHADADGRWLVKLHAMKACTQPQTWFTIAGADGKFVPAEARIVDDTVEVSDPEIQKPIALRFAWDETAQPNLFNQAGLPAEPFRTDPPGK
jgi:hypothetical protein